MDDDSKNVQENQLKNESTENFYTNKDMAWSEFHLKCLARCPPMYMVEHLEFISHFNISHLPQQLENLILCIFVGVSCPTMFSKIICTFLIAHR